MIKLKEVALKDLKDLIYIGFDGDKELLADYHISPGNLMHCVQHTFDVIEKDYKDNVFKDDVHIYAVIASDQKILNATIGFTVITVNACRPHHLLSFAINVTWRDKEILTEWLAAVEKITGLPYFTTLWNKNTRAINFFLKNGFFEIQKEQGKLLIKCDVTATIPEHPKLEHFIEC